MNAQNIYVDVRITYKICVNLPFMLPVKFLVNSRLSVVKSGGSQKLYVDFQLPRGWVGDPKPHVVQGLTDLKYQSLGGRFISIDRHLGV